MIPIRLRRFDPARDARATARLFFETVHAVNARHYAPAQLKAWAPRPPDPRAWAARLGRALTLVAETDDGTLVGFASLGPEGYLDTLYVRADMIGRGVGSALLAAIEDAARANGQPRLHTRASVTAVPFFAARGFRECAVETVTRRGIPLQTHVMDKDLTNRS